MFVYVYMYGTIHVYRARIFGEETACSMRWPERKKNDVGGSQSPHTLFMHLGTSFLPSNPQLLKGLPFPDSPKFTGEFCKKIKDDILPIFYNVFLENHSRESYQSHFMRSAYPNIKLTHKIGKFHGGHKHEQNSL